VTRPTYSTLRLAAVAAVCTATVACTATPSATRPDSIGTPGATLTAPTPNSAALRSLPDPCRLLPRTAVEHELEPATKTPQDVALPVYIPGRTSLGTSRGCVYRRGSDNTTLVTLRVIRDGVSTLFAALTDSTEPAPSPEGARWQPDGTTLWWRKGSYLLSLQVFEPKPLAAQTAALSLGAEIQRNW
jgi:hypothetical protein